MRQRRGLRRPQEILLGPAEAVNRLLSTRGDFAADPAMEKFGLTFNPNGFLKRIK